jgi:hypothetical protein
MIKEISMAMVLLFSSCTHDPVGFSTARKSYDAALNEKKESIEKDRVRAITRFFFRTLEIVRRENLSNDERAYFISRTLKQYDEVYDYKGEWVGEYAESGSENLDSLCLILGDYRLNQILEKSEFHKVLKMFRANPPESTKNFKLTQKLLDRQNIVKVPLFDYSDLYK